MSTVKRSDVSWLTSPTDVTSSSSVIHQTIPDTSYPPTEGFNSRSSSSTLNYMAISDIEEAFREVCPSDGFGGYHDGSNPNLGLPM